MSIEVYIINAIEIQLTEEEFETSTVSIHLCSLKPHLYIE